MLNTLVLHNQKGLARYSELACPYCEGIIEDKNANKLKCLHCWKTWKIHQLKCIALEERIPSTQIWIAADVLKVLGEKSFLEMILWCNEEWVIFREASYRFVWDYKFGKRLRRVKKFTKSKNLDKFDYELGIIRSWIPLSRIEVYWVVDWLFAWINNAKTPNITLSKNSSKYKSENRDKESDVFMNNIYAMVSAFVRWYKSMYDKILSDDVTDEDFDKFQELLGTWIGDDEIQRLENWDRISLSSLVPAIDYLFSRSIRPSVSLLKQSTKYPNIINDLPSTHPFYDLLREKPL